MITIEVKGIERAMKYLRERPEKIQGFRKRLVEFGIFQIERDVKNQPVSIMRVRTGRMKASIGGGAFTGGSFPKGHGITFGDGFGIIGPTVTYAKHVHQKYPFMRTGTETALPKIAAFAKKEIKRITQ